MKKLATIALTIALLTWSSISQATILSATYTGDGSGALDSTATWDADNSQLAITGTQLSLPATTSVAFTTDTDTDPSVPMPYSIGNDTDFAWTGYQVCISANKAITLLNPVVYSPSDWSISVSPTTTDDKHWEVDLWGGAPIAVDTGELDFGYTLSFTGSLQTAMTWTPLGSAPVPEPGTLILACSGLLGLATLRVLRRRPG